MSGVQLLVLIALGVSFLGCPPAGPNELPTVTLSCEVAEGGTTNCPLQVTVVFSEAVTGFDADDVKDANAHVDNFSGSGAQYTFTLTPIFDGLVRVSIPAGVALDSANGANQASEEWRWTYDGTRPSLQLTSVAAMTTASASIPVTAKFSESVTGFDEDDLVVSNATVSQFAGAGSTYSFILNAIKEGAVSVSVGDGAAQDSVGNASLADGPLTRTYKKPTPPPPPPADTTPPSVTSLTVTSSEPATESPIKIEIRFSENVTGFEVSDLSITNATAANFSGSGSTYTVDLIPTVVGGTVTIQVLAGVAQDGAGNKNTASGTKSISYEPIAVVLDSVVSGTINLSSFPVFVRFPGLVTELDASDISVVNATVSNFFCLGPECRFDVSPSGPGDVVVSIPEGAAMVGAPPLTAPSAASEVLSVTYAPSFPPAPLPVIEVNEARWLQSQRTLYNTYAEVTVTQGYAPFPVFFEGWKSAPRNEIARYAWDFGDGSEVFEGMNAAHVYETPGTYTVVLTVTNVYGVNDTEQITIEVLEPDGTTYYVDAVAGNDENDGTAPGAGAWKTAEKAFKGIEESRYGPGDRILFTRGQTFPIGARVFSFPHWRSGYGYYFGAYGTGDKPLLQYNGVGDGAILHNQSLGFAFTAFVDLAFDGTHTYIAEGGEDAADMAMIYYATGNCQNVLFLRCDMQNFAQGILLSGGLVDNTYDISGVFVVDCTSYNASVTHLYSVASRLAVLDSDFDLAGNHIAYLAAVNVGVIANSKFRRPSFGRTALRISGGVGEASEERRFTNNVEVTRNTMEGWIDPIPRQNGDGTQYNWLLVELGPNTAGAQYMRDIIFEYNVLKDAQVLLNVGTWQNAIIRNNSFSTLDTEGTARVLLGAIHNGFDTMPLKNILFTHNTIDVSPRPDGHAAVFQVKGYDGDPYEGRTIHEDIKIEQNTVIMNGGPSRLVYCQDDNPEQVAEIHTDNLVVYPAGETALYKVGGEWYSDSGTTYTLEEWRTETGNDSGTQLYDPATLPIPGWAKSQPRVASGPIEVVYEGATDRSGSGLRVVRLWVKADDGDWSDTGMTSTGEEGSFSYSATFADGSVYHFAVQAESVDGSISPAPIGSGHTSTLYQP